MRPPRIVIFAKAPEAGLCKTRLIPALGEQGAARLARRLLEYTLSQAVGANVGPVELCMSHPASEAWRGVAIPHGVRRSAQVGGDLGDRMLAATRRVIVEGDSIVLIGTDCPALDATLLRNIALALRCADAVLAPTADGGYAALGLNRVHPDLFTDIAWSTNRVVDQTLCRLVRLKWTVRRLSTVHDIDRPSDLCHLPDEWSPVV